MIVHILSPGAKKRFFLTLMHATRIVIVVMAIPVDKRMKKINFLINDIFGKYNFILICNLK